MKRLKLEFPEHFFEGEERCGYISPEMKKVWAVELDDLKYLLYHNASVQSYHETDIYITPDIMVFEDITPSETTNYYKSNKRFSFIHNSEMITFCEAKHFMPFPEL